MERTPSDLSTPTVLKFGGTSVEDAAACARVAGIVRAHGRARPVVVVSALAGVTDALLGCAREGALRAFRSEEHTSELQSQSNLVCRLLLEKRKIKNDIMQPLILLTVVKRHEL